MISDPTGAERHALGDFVRAHRARLTPSMCGLPEGTRRRTPGLRREEMAQLCGMSVTWYSWIEQGRDVSVSAAALDRLAKALRLSRAERAYLFDLAGKHDAARPGGDGDVRAPAALAASLAAIAMPAYVLDRAWRATAWNGPAARLFRGWLDDGEGERDRNLLRYIFLAPQARSLIVGWEDRARRVLAEFRADVSAHLHDDALRELVADLRAGSRFFARIWDEHSVVSREGGERRFSHPEDGPLTYEQITFNLAGRPEVKLVLLAPVTPPV